MFYPLPYLSQVWFGGQASSKFLPPAVRPVVAHIKLAENCQASCTSGDYWKSRWQDAISTNRAVALLKVTAWGTRKHSADEVFRTSQAGLTISASQSSSSVLCAGAISVNASPMPMVESQ